MRVRCRWAEGHDREGSSVIALDFRPHIDNLPDQLTAQFHYEIQLRHKCRVIPITVQHIVFHTAGPVNIPEGLADQVFSGFVVIFCFWTNDNLFF